MRDNNTAETDKIGLQPWTVLTSSNKNKTAVHSCNPTLSVSVGLVSRKVNFYTQSDQPLQIIARKQNTAANISSQGNQLLTAPKHDKILGVFLCEQRDIAIKARGD